MAGEKAATNLLKHMEDVECVVRCLLPGDEEAATAAYWHDAQKIAGWDNGWNVVQRNAPLERGSDLWNATVGAHRYPNTEAPAQFSGARIGDLIAGHHHDVLADDPGLSAWRIGDAISAKTRAYEGGNTWADAYDTVFIGNWKPGYFQGVLDWGMLRNPALRGLR